MMSTGMSTLNLSGWQIPIFLCSVGALILFSLITNIVVVYIITHTPSFRIAPYCYVLSLSIGDIIQSLIVMPVTAYFNLFGVNSAACKFWSVILSFRIGISVFSHGAMVVNSYFAILRTISYHNEIRCHHPVLCVFGFGITCCFICLGPGSYERPPLSLAFGV
jgi:hypothetical protein